jgi:hypothetical protein
MSTWNRGHIVGQKATAEAEGILEYPDTTADIRRRKGSGFNLAIGSKLRGCDLVALRVGDVALSGAVRDRGVVIQRKTGRPLQLRSPSRHAPPSRHGSLAEA